MVAVYENELGINAVPGCNIKPAIGKIFVKMNPPTSAGGIILSDKQSAESETSGVIMALSDGNINANGDLKDHNYEVGSHILVNLSFNRTKIPDTITGEGTLVVIQESEILGVVIQPKSE